MLTMPHANFAVPQSWHVGLVTSRKENLLHELVLGAQRCSLQCRVEAQGDSKGPETRAQAGNRDPRTVRNSLMVSCWSMEKSNLESPEKIA